MMRTESMHREYRHPHVHPPPLPPVPGPVIPIFTAMELVYHQGRNFGDALNPLIFHSHFPWFSHHDDSTLFIGIVSIIGLKKPTPNTKRRIYFSSGFAAGDAATYGTAPTFGPADDVVCVRGPLTAQALG